MPFFKINCECSLENNQEIVPVGGCVLLSGKSNATHNKKFRIPFFPIKLMIDPFFDFIQFSRLKGRLIIR